MESDLVGSEMEMENGLVGSRFAFVGCVPERSRLAFVDCDLVGSRFAFVEVK